MKSDQERVREEKEIKTIAKDPETSLTCTTNQEDSTATIGSLPNVKVNGCKSPPAKQKENY